MKTDFEININENKTFKILQITDMQPVDPSQQRYDGRLNIPICDEYPKEKLYKEILFYIEKLIKDNSPDLIIVTGDIVYGEFDDSGKNLITISKYIDSFGIPWAPVFGNHDNESKKGVAWQCSVFESMPHCLFKRGNVTGNSNYTIGIKRCNELIKVIYMMDSNGCYNGKKYSYLEDYPLYNQEEKIQTVAGIYQDQRDWIESTSKEIGIEIPKIIAFHIPPSEISKQAKLNGYQTTDLWENYETYELNKDVPAINDDFGVKLERFCTFDSTGLWPLLKRNNFTHMFVGHDHVNTLSILVDRIRVTYGVKTGTHDYTNFSGGTLITIEKDSSIRIEHKIIDYIK